MLTMYGGFYLTVISPLLGSGCTVGGTAMMMMSTVLILMTMLLMTMIMMVAITVNPVKNTMKHSYNGRNLPIMNMVEYGTGKFAFNHIDIGCVMEAIVFFLL